MKTKPGVLLASFVLIAGLLAALAAHADEIPAGCSPAEIAALRAEWSVKQVQNEWSTVHDILVPLVFHYDNGTQDRVRKTENCLDIGALSHQVPYAIGKTAAYEPFTHDAELLRLVGHMRKLASDLSVYCMNDGDDRDARAALDGMTTTLPLLRARLVQHSIWQH